MFRSADYRSLHTTIRLHIPNIAKLSRDGQIFSPYVKLHDLQLALVAEHTHNEHLSIRLFCLPPQRVRDAYICTVMFGVHLVSGSPKRTVFRIVTGEYKCGEKWNHGWREFMHWKELLSPNNNFVANDGSILLEAEVTVEMSIFSKKFDDPTAPGAVTLVVGSRRFFVSKHMLAESSEFFRALLFGDFSDSQKSEIDLVDVNPTDFLDFLRFLHYPDYYAGLKCVGTALALADRFCADIVLTRCQRAMLRTRSNTWTIVLRMLYAEKYKLPLLRQQCIYDAQSVPIPVVEPFCESFDDNEITNAMKLLNDASASRHRDPKNTKVSVHS